MAPWCPACRAFQDAWKEFAGWGYDLDVSVGVIDVTENPGEDEEVVILLVVTKTNCDITTF